MRPNPVRPRNEAEAIAQLEGSSGSLDLVRRRQWGTIVTVLLLAVLLGAGIASVLLR